jgi:hypothetical protein
VLFYFNRSPMFGCNGSCYVFVLVNECHQQLSSKIVINNCHQKLSSKIVMYTQLLIANTKMKS